MRFLFLVLAFLLGACTTVPPGPMTREAKIGEAFRAAVEGHPDRAGAGLLVSSDRLGFSLITTASPDGLDRPFHAASVGKLFTTVLVARLIDQGRLTLDTVVAPLLPLHTLDGLFIVHGSDHQGEVTVGQLLAHTSGLADPFEDKGADGKTLVQRILAEPSRRWTPADLLAYQKSQFSALAAPASGFHYSDAGYFLLGLVVEALGGSSFEDQVTEQIFRPLRMDHTFFPHRTQPAVGSSVLRPAWLAGTEVSAFESITADWAGGGVASTEQDLLAFDEAFWSGRLVSAATLASLQAFDHTFQPGIHYGYGLMQFRMEEFFFLLSGYPRVVGHMGLLGTQLLYDAADGVHIIVNLGSDAAIEDSVKLVIDVLAAVKAR